MKFHRPHLKTLLPFALFAAVVFTGVRPPIASLQGSEQPKPSATNAKRLDAVQKRVATELESLKALYKHLHSHPELSYHEEKSAERVAKELKDLGFEVTEKFGGYGVVGVFKNGKGPTVLVPPIWTRCRSASAPGCPTPARCGRATRTITRSESCTLAATICT